MARWRDLNPLASSAAAEGCPGTVEIWRGELAKTTTLKVNCGRLREAVLAGWRGAGEAPSTLAPTVEEAPRSEAESWVIDTVARLTRTRPEPIRAADRLADLGVDSLTHAERIAPSKPAPVALWTTPPRWVWSGCGICSKRCSRTPPSRPRS